MTQPVLACRVMLFKGEKEEKKKNRKIFNSFFIIMIALIYFSVTSFHFSWWISHIAPSVGIVTVGVIADFYPPTEKHT